MINTITTNPRSKAALNLVIGIPPHKAADSDVLSLPLDPLLHYWITSSARASSEGGIVSPSALAVLRLMTSSNLEGCSTGRSAGFVPLRILSTNDADRR